MSALRTMGAAWGVTIIDSCAGEYWYILVPLKYAKSMLAGSQVAVPSLLTFQPMAKRSLGEKWWPLRTDCERTLQLSFGAEESSEVGVALGAARVEVAKKMGVLVNAGAIVGDGWDVGVLVGLGTGVARPAQPVRLSAKATKMIMRLIVFPVLCPTFRIEALNRAD
jgi:hypothetical protein